MLREHRTLSVRDEVGSGRKRLFGAPIFRAVAQNHQVVVALWVAAFSPAFAIECWGSLATAMAASERLAYFFLGLVAYGGLWWALFRKASLTWLSTFEHEFTHCLFAWVTCNRVTGFNATLRGGGHMTYRGTPNWLISVAPYFFPTVTMGLLAGLSLSGLALSGWMLGALGASVACHATSTWAEIHPGQTDFYDAGRIFCLLFVPGANLLIYSIVLNTVATGQLTVIDSLHRVLGSDWTLLHWAMR